MIVGRDAETYTIVRQVDHQAQCALMARAWGNADFARLADWDAVEAAAACHDEGWRAWDDAPCIDDAGAPVDFPDLDRAVHMAMFRAGIAAAVAADQRTGLVVCMHGRGLYEKRLGLDGPAPARAERNPAERAFIDDHERLQHVLEARLGPDAQRWAWAAFRLLQAWDVISLYLTWHGLRAAAEWVLPQVPVAPDDQRGRSLRVSPAGESGCTLHPWPFAQEHVDLPVAYRVIPRRAYADDGDLRSTLAAAPVRTWALTAERR